VFTLVIKGLKKEKTKLEEEKLSFTNLDIEAFHDDCHNGRVRIIPWQWYRWELECERCREDEAIEFTVKERILIIETAIDGKERKIRNNLRVVHRNYQGKRCSVCDGAGWVITPKR
jgi:hypothetical protein